MQQADPERRLRRLGWGIHALGAGVLVAMAVLAELLVFQPNRDFAGACSQQAAELEVTIRDGNRVRAEHAQLAEELADARRQAVLLQTRIPDKPQEAEFLGQASKLANEVGLQIRDYRPGTPVSTPSHSLLKVDLICKGDYASICRFLDQLATLPRHANVTCLQIDDDGSSPEYSVKISVILYYAAGDPASDDGKGTTDA